MASIIKVDNILDSQGNKFDGSQLGNVGKVLQVYNHNWQSEYASTSTSFQDVPNTVFSFTPKSSSSKLIIQVNVSVNLNTNGAGTNNGMEFKLQINNSDIKTEGSGGHEIYLANPASSSSDIYLRPVKMYTYNVSSLNTLSFKLQLRGYNTIGLIKLNQASQFWSDITVWEIGA